MPDDVVVNPPNPVTPAPVVPAPAAAVDGKPAPVVEPPAPVKPAEGGEKPTGDKPVEPAKKTTLLGEDEVKAGEEGKPKEGEAPKGVVPEKYEIKVPEGMTVDGGLLEAVTPVFKELGITQEAAQKLADAYAPVIAKQAQAAKDAALKAFDAQIEAWGNETKAMLGADAAKQIAPATKFINTFGGADAPAIRALLTETGLGNHPLIVKMLIAGGKAISQDKFVDGASGAGIDTPDAAMGRLYPSMNKK